MKKTLIAITVVIAIYFTGWGLTSCMIDQQNRGPFGDQFGEVNALFSGLAFAVILGALIHQHEETLQQKAHFQEQIKLQALIEYSTIARALWESARDQKLYHFGQGALGEQAGRDWEAAEKTRYNELMDLRKKLATKAEHPGCFGAPEPRAGTSVGCIIDD